MREHWLTISEYSPIGILTDLDGTLIPFAPLPSQARPGRDVLRVVHALCAVPSLAVSVVSGRKREELDAFFPPAPGLWLFAEHGGWCRTEAGWEAQADTDPGEMEPLAEQFERVAGAHAGAVVERKTWSTTLHYRAVEPVQQPGLLAAATDALDPWLRSNPVFERLDGKCVIEIRPAWLRKSLAVHRMREHGGARIRLIAFGDDFVDEDMFAALGLDDEAVKIGPPSPSGTRARWVLDDHVQLLSFLDWMAGRRTAQTPSEPRSLPRPIWSTVNLPLRPKAFDLLTVSNRLPELRSPTLPRDPRRRNVGGLVAALEPVMKSRRALWLGWSGRIGGESDIPGVELDTSDQPALAWVDLPPLWHESYYNGFCNRALWPIFHTFPGRVKFSDVEWQTYCKVNDAFADAALDLIGPDTPVWVHDYHLLLVAQALRRRGHTGPTGLFLHTPFPAPDTFELVPWAEQVLEGMLDFDLLGFHTPTYARNFLECLAPYRSIRREAAAVVHRGRRIRVQAFPIGIIPENFQETPDPDTAKEAAALLQAIAPGRLILGVDRLDYTKGIPERLYAFARLLERFPRWRKRVSLVQISVPSREDVPDYMDQRKSVENAVGYINGKFGDETWVPVRYLYRSYRPDQLAAFYRAAAVGYVTPLRDGMNLVAKEYVAAQDPADPGVLVLSRFAGAATELVDAVLTNPWHIEGMADDLNRALRMGLTERRERHGRLQAAVGKATAVTWADDFLAALETCRPACT